ncbi:serine hydrolase domain-containing protein [Micromonospora sp. NPDC000089]|uniref:serine hydrolase domain-containing protein n=1 Tax=unclassified Micromonospora TaxID=2617518 RepID=UPI0036C9A9B8
MRRAARTALAGTTVMLVAAGVAGLVLDRPFAAARSGPAGQPLQPAAGWPADLGERVGRIAEERGAEAVVALEGDRLAGRWGSVDERYNVASIRKSIVSALFGVAADRGLVDLDATLGQLGIDETATPLTPIERTATVRDLLSARSGIYLPTSGENAGMRDRKPARGAYRPGTHFYYNNWDFNVLGTILERQTKLSLGQAFDDWIARPTGMTGFTPDDVVYSDGGDSDHRMYRFYLSAEDLARFGALYADGGRWGDRQVVPAAWVAESLRPHSTLTATDSPDYRAYGYLWWLDPEHSLAYGIGSGGQWLRVDPARHRVIVVLNDTGTSPLRMFSYRHLDGGEVLRDAPDRIAELVETVAPTGTAG